MLSLEHKQDSTFMAVTRQNEDSNFLEQLFRPDANSTPLQKQSGWPLLYSQIIGRKEILTSYSYALSMPCMYIPGDEFFQRYYFIITQIIVWMDTCIFKLEKYHNTFKVANFKNVGSSFTCSCGFVCMHMYMFVYECINSSWLNHSCTESALYYRVHI